MALTTEDMIEGIRASRAHFLKHLSGLSEAQWTWKPYPECKSVVETVAHLIVDDRAALASLQSGEEPDYEVLAVSEQEAPKLLDMLARSHQQLCELIREKYGNAPLDVEATVWGTPLKLGRAIAHFSSEDYYHAGQVAFIRQATDPQWNYYAHIYGE